MSLHKHHKRQVMALRPQARAILTPNCGWLVFDGEQCLNNGGNDPFSQEWKAWELAFRHLMHDFRESEVS